MEELHKIEYPEQKKYYIAYDDKGEVKTYGIVETNQCMSTMCHTLKIYNENEQPKHLDYEQS